MCEMRWNVGTNQEHELITTKHARGSQSPSLMLSTCTSKKIQVIMFKNKFKNLKLEPTYILGGFIVIYTKILTIITP